METHDAGDLTPTTTGVSEQNIPLLLRHAPALIASVCTLALGIALLRWAALAHEKHSFESAVLVNTGSSVLLFAPLALLTSFFGRRIVRAANAQTSRIEELESEVDDVRQDFETALARISSGATAMIAGDRKEIEDAIESVLGNPNSSSIAEVIRHGIEHRYLSKRGPRVALNGTSAYVRWTVDEFRTNEVVIVVETMGGEIEATFAWRYSESAEQFGYSLGKELQEAGAYPGDAIFDVGSLFLKLHELVNLGYRSATGAEGVTDPVGPIIELTGSKWAITDFWITTREWPQYQITLDRLNEQDWDEHIRGKYDMDIVGFRMASDIAKSLIESGELAIPDYEEGFRIRII